jgi:hypothetical protein
MPNTDVRTHLDRITDRIFAIFGAILDGMERRRAPGRPLIGADAGLSRWTNDQFGFSRLCGKTACRRARCCRGEPRACSNRHLPSVPQPARDRVSLMLRARRTLAES